jgi:hypothetical protein
MAEDSNPQPTPDPVPDPKPDDQLILGKFKDQAALETAYKELETKLGQQPDPAPAPKPDDSKLTIIKPEPAADSDSVNAALVKAGLDPQAVASQWMEHGELTPDQYAALQRHGKSRTDVDLVAEAMAIKARNYDADTNAAIKQAQDLMGGSSDEDNETRLANLRQWAGTNMDKQRLAMLNEQVQANPSFYPDMVRLILTEHQAAVGAGNTQPLISGSAPASGAGAISNHDDMKKALAAAKRGDKAAQARIAATPVEQLAQLV